MITPNEKCQILKNRSNMTFFGEGRDEEAGEPEESEEGAETETHGEDEVWAIRRNEVVNVARTGGGDNLAAGKD